MAKKHSNRTLFHITSKLEVVIDASLEALIPPLAKDEQAKLEASIEKEGCLEPLCVWKEQNVLIDGHNRAKICKEKGIEPKVHMVSLKDQDEAELFIVTKQLARRNLTPEALSYLRGKRYLKEKLPHGGDRISIKASEQTVRLPKTSEKLAAEYKVDEITIRRDGKFARAVDHIVECTRPDIRNLLLSRDVTISRGMILKLSRESDSDIKKAIEELQTNKKLSRKAYTRKKDRPTISLPKKPQGLVRELVKTMEVQDLEDIHKLLGEKLMRMKNRK